MERKKSQTGVVPRRNTRVTLLPPLTIPILIFLAVFFLLLGIGRPALYMNDEFIVVNQLHQLSESHQILINEGKYGQYPNGTPLEYFTNKQNILGYSIFLPLLSLPILQFFTLFGEGFRLPLVLVWSVIPLLITMIISNNGQNKCRVFAMPLICVGAGFSLLLLVINIYYYHSFPFSAPDAPAESAAVILTNSIIGSLLAVIIYLTAERIWRDTKVALLCTFALFSCSSYLFWSVAAKDHMLMTLCLAGVVYFFVTSISLEKVYYLYIGFICIGLLAWVRPEAGLSIFIGCLLFLIINAKLYQNPRFSWRATILNTISATGATFLGAIPLFINNQITTGNFLIPTFYYYISKTAPPGAVITGTLATSLDPQSTVSELPSLIPSYYLSTSGLDFFTAIGEIIFRPPSGNMSIAAVSPLFLAGLVILILWYIWKKPEIGVKDTQILILLSICIFFSFVAYATSITSVSRSPGIVPDMRYFIPVYFLGGIIGFYPLTRLMPDSIRRISLWHIGGTIGGAGLLSILILLLMPGAGTPFTAFAGVYITLSYGGMIFFLLSLGGYCKGWYSSKVPALFFLLMIAIPLSWQFTMDAFCSVVKLYGYPFWMPYPEYLIERYLIPIIVT